MFIVVLVRWLLGYVSFAGEGGFPERFINLCVKAHIPLWDLSRADEQLTGKTTIRGYKHIRPIVHLSGVRVHITGKRGLPFWSARHRRRAGLIAGLLAAAVVIACLSVRIWTVSVTGNAEIPAETILAAAEELGVRVGAKRSDLDTAALAEALLDNVDGLSWAAVNIDNCRAVIEVRESTPAPEILDTQTPSNIIAGADGVLTKIEVYSGTAAAEPGSGVVQGDLLISGVVENADGSQTLHGAQGNVYAEVTENMSFSCPDAPFLRLSASATRYSLFFFGLRIPLGFSPGEQDYTVERYLSNDELALPVGILRERAEVYNTAYTLENKTDRARFAAARFAARFAELWTDSVILHTALTFDFEAEDPYISGTVLCEKEIGINQQIFVEKISD